MDDFQNWILITTSSNCNRKKKTMALDSQNKSKKSINKPSSVRWAKMACCVTMGHIGTQMLIRVAGIQKIANHWTPLDSLMGGWAALLNKCGHLIGVVIVIVITNININININIIIIIIIITTGRKVTQNLPMEGNAEPYWHSKHKTNLDIIDIIWH